ncbi:MAG: hypothetical protein H6644_09875 [Caldilineaceae bacterium]|nr:hypothetical protein [Caldilineaceae bacterium]
MTAPEHDVIAAKTSTSDLPVVQEIDLVNSLPAIRKESLATKAQALEFSGKTEKSPLAQTQPNSLTLTTSPLRRCASPKG